MAEQLHKRRTTEQVVDIVHKYQRKEIKAKEAAAYLGVGPGQSHERMSPQAL